MQTYGQPSESEPDEIEKLRKYSEHVKVSQSKTVGHTGSLENCKTIMQKNIEKRHPNGQMTPRRGPHDNRTTPLRRNDGVGCRRDATGTPCVHWENNCE